MRSPVVTILGAIGAILFCASATQADYAEETACKAANSKIAFPLPYSPTSETVEITFTCAAGKTIQSCQLPSQPPKRLDRDSSSVEQTFIGQDGAFYTVTCYDHIKPSIRENFIATLASEDEKVIDVKVTNEPGKTISVYFSVNKRTKKVRSCTPAWSRRIWSLNSAIIDGPSGKKKYRFFCHSDKRPVIRLTFAAEACADESKLQSFDVKTSGGDVVDSMKMKFRFVCNDDKNKIRQCIPEGFNGKTIPASGERVSFGGEFGNLQTVMCDYINGPSTVQQNNFAEQPDPKEVITEPVPFNSETYLKPNKTHVETNGWDLLRNTPNAIKICALTTKAKEFNVGKDSTPILVTFVCDENNEKIKSCKPKGKFRKINAKETDSFAGGKYKLTCNETEEPSFPE